MNSVDCWRPSPGGNDGLIARLTGCFSKLCPVEVGRYLIVRGICGWVGDRMILVRVIIKGIVTIAI